MTAKWRREGLGNKVYILDPWGEVNKVWRSRRRAGELLRALTRCRRSIRRPPTTPWGTCDITYFADALVVTSPKTPRSRTGTRAPKSLSADSSPMSSKRRTSTPGRKTLKTVRDLLNLPSTTIAHDLRACGGAWRPTVLRRRSSARFEKDTTEVSGVF